MSNGPTISRTREPGQGTTNEPRRNLANRGRKAGHRGACPRPGLKESFSPGKPAAIAAFEKSLSQTRNHHFSFRIRPAQHHSWQACDGHEAYTSTGYDRGHMAPSYAIGTRYGHEAQRETFLMSNIVPQSPDLNRIWWRVLEEKEANDFAVRLERVWVVTGPVFAGEVKKLPSGVDVPTAFFLLRMEMEEKKTGINCLILTVLLII